MININSISNADVQRNLEYHRDLLRIAEQARMAREAVKANLVKPSTSRRWDWLLHPFRARRQYNRAAHVRS